MTTITTSSTTTQAQTSVPTIAHLAVGASVIFRSGAPNAAAEVARVEKITATQVAVRGERFPREQETCVRATGRGSSFFRSSIRIPENGELARVMEENRKLRQAAKLHRTDWGQVPATKLDEIIRILERVETP